MLSKALARKLSLTRNRVREKDETKQCNYTDTVERATFQSISRETPPSVENRNVMMIGSKTERMRRWFE
jgi:hypothetical protein